MKQRLFSASLAIPVVFAVIFFFNLFLTHLFFYVLLLLFIKELFALTATAAPRAAATNHASPTEPLSISSYARQSTFLVFSLCFWAHYFILAYYPAQALTYSNWLLPAALSLSFLLLSLRAPFQKSFQSNLSTLAHSFVILFYGVFLAMHILKLKYLTLFLSSPISETLGYQGAVPPGAYLLTYALCVAWAYDSGAYFAGRFLGKKRLGLAASPNKTWMGLGGGLLAALLAYGGLLFLSQKLLFQPLSAPQVAFSLHRPLIGLPLTLLLALAGQLGDLIASAHKRGAAVSDSGKFLSGHGGIYDRLDSLLVVCFLLYYFALAGLKL